MKFSKITLKKMHIEYLELLINSLEYEVNNNRDAFEYAKKDLEEAEKLSVQTGRKAMDLAKAKGKASEDKKWSEVVKDSEFLTTEEQLGLTKEQSKRLKDRKLSREERIDVAILLLNRTFTFDEVTEELDAGKTVEELVKQDIH